jgi:hypothetical protein
MILVFYQTKNPSIGVIISKWSRDVVEDDLSYSLRIFKYIYIIYFIIIYFIIKES